MRKAVGSGLSVALGGVFGSGDALDRLSWLRYLLRFCDHSRKRVCRQWQFRWRIIFHNGLAQSTDIAFNLLPNKFCERCVGNIDRGVFFGLNITQWRATILLPEIRTAC